MKYALHGLPGSGKTTLAKSLEKHGFQLVSFTDFLKILLSSCIDPLVPFSVEEIHKNKKQYRKLLQEFSKVIRFDSDVRYVDALLEGIPNDTSIVFDCIRSEQQAERLKAKGFIVVHLQLNSSSDRITATEEELSDETEKQLPASLIDLTLNAERSTDELVRMLCGSAVINNIKKSSNVSPVAKEL